MREPLRLLPSPALRPLGTVAPGAGRGAAERSEPLLPCMHQLCPNLYEYVQEGHGIFLNGFSLTHVPVFMQLTIFPLVLALTVTGFFSIGFILIFF